MVRKIYLLISTLILVGSFILPIYFCGGKGFAVGLLFYCIYSLITAVVTIVYMQRGIVSGDVGDTIITPFGFLTFGFKKIYYSDLGYFWIRKRGSQVNLYKQKLFVMNKIGDVFWSKNIEHLKLEIKNQLEEIYRVQLELKREKDLENKIWSEWDGSVDKKSERDNKLNELGV